MSNQNHFNVMQDGSNFYLYDSAENFEATIIYPYKVSDSDMRAARKAKAWFIDLATRLGFTVSFEGN